MKLPLQELPIKRDRSMKRRANDGVVRICAPFFEPVDGLISAKDSGGIIGFGMNLE